MRSILLAIAILISLGNGLLAGTLGDAAKSGDAALVTKLLDEGADIDEVGTFGTALHWAALNNHAEVVTLLAARGADLSAKSDLLGTPLHAAAQRDYSEVASVLLDHGASADTRDRAQCGPWCSVQRMTAKSPYYRMLRQVGMGHEMAPQRRESRGRKPNNADTAPLTKPPEGSDFRTDWLSASS